ncbi:MAG: hypothetical protein KAX49_11515 [Halanaerobiales bacterium]|nr:hypothetical protein [Halanaerobiales bacterium]
MVKSADLFSRETIIRYQEFKDWIKEHGEYRIHIFDQIRSYQERLKHYRILPEEWKNIRDTNGSEGGVDRFFEKSKTTKQLLDNMLIPGVEEMIFQDEKRKKELFTAFSEYRNMLLEIPIIKANIKDFEVIRQHAEAVVEEVQKLDQFKQKYDEKTKELIRLAKTFSDFENEAKRALDDLLKKLTQSQIEKTALYYYNQAEEAKKEVINYQNKLNLLEQSEPELQKQLIEVKQQLRFAWEKESEHLQNKLLTIEDQIKSLNKDSKLLQDKMEDARGQDDEYRDQLALVKA